jgi:hypothetical protein
MLCAFGTLQAQVPNAESQKILVADLPNDFKYELINDSTIMMKSSSAVESLQNLKKPLGSVKLQYKYGDSKKEKVFLNTLAVSFESRNGTSVIISDENNNTFKIPAEIDTEVRVFGIDWNTEVLYFSKQKPGNAPVIFFKDLRSKQISSMGNGVRLKSNNKGMVVFREISDENIHPAMRYRAGKIDAKQARDLAKQPAPTMLWKVLDLNTKNVLPLEGYEDATHISWSPDGDFIYLNDRKAGDFVLEILADENSISIGNVFQIAGPEEEMNYAVWTLNSRNLTYIKYDLNESGNTYISSTIELIRLNGENKRPLLTSSKGVIYEDVLWISPNEVVFIENNSGNKSLKSQKIAE